MSGLVNWSTDASSNDVSDPPILWQEGQPASTVNNSAREMMAALARWHTDAAGCFNVTLSGSGALRAATLQGLTAANFTRPFSVTVQLPDGFNQGPVTLDLDSTGARPIKRPGFAELGPGDFVPGVPYHLLWLPNLAGYVLAWPHLGRPGTIGIFGGPDAVPSGWVPCDGRSLPRVNYLALFLAIGGYHGLPDDNTFRVPDLRGRALFGADAGAGRLTGAGGLGGGVGNSGGAETVQLSEAQLASHSHGGSTAGAGAHDHTGSTGQAGNHSHGGQTGGGGDHSHSGTTNGGGGHSHSGSTDTAGAHSHGIGYVRQTNYRTDGASGGVNALNAGEGGTNTTGITDPNGAHSHGLTISTAPDHTHGFNTNTVGQHAHTIAADGQHGHAIAGVGDHAHGLSIAAAGGGQAHSNMPPGLVVTFAIKA